MNKNFKFLNKSWADHSIKAHDRFILIVVQMSLFIFDAPVFTNYQQPKITKKEHDLASSYFVLLIKSNMCTKATQVKSKHWPFSTGYIYSEGDLINHGRFLKHWPFILG